MGYVPEREAWLETNAVGSTVVGGLEGRDIVEFEIKNGQKCSVISAKSEMESEERE